MKKKRSGYCIYSSGESGDQRFPLPRSASSIAIPFLRETQKKERKKERKRERTTVFLIHSAQNSLNYSQAQTLFPLGTGFCFEILNLKEEPNQNQIKSNQKPFWSILNFHALRVNLSRWVSCLRKCSLLSSETEKLGSSFSASTMPERQPSFVSFSHFTLAHFLFFNFE